jgi:hypothetical protein
MQLRLKLGCGMLNAFFWLQIPLAPVEMSAKCGKGIKQNVLPFAA